MKKYKNLILTFLLIAGLIGCNLNSDSGSDDAVSPSNENPTSDSPTIESQELSITGFTPGTVIPGSRLIINGENIPDDIAGMEVSVEIFGNSSRINLIILESSASQVVVEIPNDIMTNTEETFLNVSPKVIFNGNTYDFENLLRIEEPVSVPLDKLFYTNNRNFITFEITEPGSYLIGASVPPASTDLKISLYEGPDLTKTPLVLGLNETGPGESETIRIDLESSTYTIMIEEAGSSNDADYFIVISNKAFQGYTSCNFFADSTKGYCMDLSIGNQTQMCLTSQQSYNTCAIQNPANSIVAKCTYMDSKGPLTRVYYSNSAKSWDSISAKSDCETISNGNYIFDDNIVTPVETDISLGLSSVTLAPGANAKFQLVINHSESKNPTESSLSQSIEKINVSINEIKVTDSNNVTSTIQNVPYSLDLIALAENSSLEAVNADVQSGTYCDLNLLFDEANTVTVDGVDKPLKTPGGLHWQSGFRLNTNGCVDIPPNTQVTMSIDFGPKDSLVYNPTKDAYILKPLYKVSNTSIQALNSYNIHSTYDGESIVAYFNTRGDIRWISSMDIGETVYDGKWTYDPITNLISIDYEIVAFSEIDCTSCTMYATYKTEYYCPTFIKKFEEFELLDYEDNLLKLKMIETGEILSFTGRTPFGPYKSY